MNKDMQFDIFLVINLIRLAELFAPSLPGPRHTYHNQQIYLYILFTNNIIIQLLTLYFLLNKYIIMETNLIQLKSFFKKLNYFHINGLS